MSAPAVLAPRTGTLREAAPYHVLFIIDQLCEMGGAERVLLNTVRLLPRDRFDPQLITFKIDRSLGIFDDFPCRWQLWPLNRTWDVNAARVGWQLNRLIRRDRIDIVHTFFESSDIWAGPIARLSGAPILISSRRDMGILRSIKHRLAYRVINPVFHEVQTVSDQVRRYMIEHDGLPPMKVRTIYNGVDIDRVASAPPEDAVRAIPVLRRASHVILTVGHIRKVKGMDVLLRAAAIIQREFPRAAFVVIGDNHQPTHYEELLRVRNELGLTEAVYFPGPIEAVFSVLKASTLFCLPSRSEGLSNALLEAMACSLPCVATDVGGNPELIADGSNGLLVPPEDPERMAEAILTLLRDPVRAARMGAAGRALVERQFTTEAMMANLVRSYERLLDKHSAK